MVSESTLTIATTLLAAPLALLGWEFRPVIQAKAKKVRFEFMAYLNGSTGEDGGRALRGRLHL